MEFRRTVSIDRPVGSVFAFMRDFENHPQEANSQVLRVEKLTPGPVGVGSRYRETVQMLPLIAVRMISEITQFESESMIAYLWHGGGMRGDLRISFEPHADGTLLTVHERIEPQGVMKVVSAVIGAAFRRTWEKRLQAIKHVLESHS